VHQRPPRKTKKAGVRQVQQAYHRSPVFYLQSLSVGNVGIFKSKIVVPIFFLSFRGFINPQVLSCDFTALDPTLELPGHRILDF